MRLRQNADIRTRSVGFEHQCPRAPLRKIQTRLESHLLFLILAQKIHAQ